VNELLALLDERIAMAGSYLYDALRVDLGRYVSRQLEDRLRARPHFLARTPPEELRLMRRRFEEGIGELVETVGHPVNDLRHKFAAAPRDEKIEAEALTTAVGELVVAAMRTLLELHGFPSDRAPDREGDAPEEGGREYQLSWIPSPPVLWAWREVCAMGQLRARLESAGTPAIAPDFALRFYLPEAELAKPT
jgi:hypothetical protein